MKQKFIKGRGYETYNKKDLKKEYKEEAQSAEETDEEQEDPVLLDTHVNKIFHWIFSNIEVESLKLHFKWLLYSQVLHF